MPLPKQDLNIDDLERFLDCDGGKTIEQFVLCGETGDAIYYPHLFEFFNRFRNSKKFHLFTNGSHQSEIFWKKMAETVTDQDTIVFAIDGIGDDNLLYRKNSNWDSIIKAINIMKQSPAKLIWQTIIFKFNQHKITEIENFAKSNGFEFNLIKSHRFDGDDNLIPNEENVAIEFMYKDDYTKNKSFLMEPKCLIERTVLSDGRFFPCDWIRNPYVYFKTELHKQPERWVNKLNIKTINYDQGVEIISDWAEFVKENAVSNPKLVSPLCKMKCRKLDI